MENPQENPRLGSVPKVATMLRISAHQATRKLSFSALFGAQGRHVAAVCCHPGVILTNLARHIEAGPMARAWGVAKVLCKPLFKSIPQGAATQTYLATAPKVEGGEVSRAGIICGYSAQAQAAQCRFLRKLRNVDLFCKSSFGEIARNFWCESCENGVIRPCLHFFEKKAGGERQVKAA